MQTDAPLSAIENLPQLHGVWWRLGQVVWLAVAFFVAGLVLLSLPLALIRYSTICTGPDCLSFSLYPRAIEELAAIGFTPNLYAATIIGLDIAIFLIYFGLAAFIFYHASRQVIGWVMAFSFLVMSTGFQQSTLTLQIQYPFINTVLNVLGAVTLMLPFIFPDGRFVPRWNWLPALLFFAALEFYAFFFVIPNIPAPAFIINTVLVVALSCQGVAIYGQVYRYRHATNTQQRQQLRWGAFGICGFIMALITWAIFFEQYIAQGIQTGVRHNLIALPINYTFTIILPVTLTYAILRFQLWQINVIFNRALVYGSLTVMVVLLYVIIVSGLSLLLHVENNIVLSLIATGVIAVIFHPVREWLQGRVNRLLYGERDNPLRVLSRLGEVLVSAESAVHILPAYTQVIAESLKLPYVAIWIRQDETQFVPLAHTGEAATEMQSIPLLYHNQHVGQLVVTYRVGETGFNRADTHLLQQIANQTAMAVNTVRLTRDLQHSRERIITSREEERRRLRRDLHDGLGPMLAGQGLKLAAAKQVMLKQPETAQTLLTDVIQKNEETVSEVRRLVYGLRPPTLDELELVASLEVEGQAILGQIALKIEISPDPLPPLSAAVEVAVYRIIMEALNNVARHAQAKNCWVQLKVANQFTLSIQDDGQGLPPQVKLGVGLQSMAERTAELDGTFSTTNLPEGGTQILAMLPLGETTTERRIPQ